MNNRPFSAVVCRSASCADASGQLLERLRAAVRHCPHGVLISSGCLLHANRCRTAPAHDSGAYLLVQPCDLDRRPLGMAIGIGPVLSDADAAVVAEWLGEGRLDASLLERRLRISAQSAR